ncbi:hypothetical protein QBC46DRAFT_379763 [Diplogelasinospora grovesii]|uniref:Uncharacterized protein n=1 Tax=Diplogelasinospora grovesii TaxID=303347 RepID=A0AAN6S7C0_9PEZI|nr:hypothetical protein QBC46DRAFT_379763 [Diplogelasinospora grovesii]
MKSSILFLAFVSSAVCGELLEVRATACGAGNNCQRGVGGTAGVKPPLSSRMADCSSLNTVTVTPAPYTTTTTSTVLEIPSSVKKRQDDAGTAVTVTPTAVPTYATYCANPPAYYSACSCAGATPTTTFAPTPTVTATETVTETCALKRSVKRSWEDLKDYAYVR